MLLALSAGQKTGLALVGGAFIVFAIVSALWLPRVRPDFPGKHVRLFAAVSILFTIGMLAAVIGLAGESETKAGRVTTGATTPSTTAPPTSAGTTTAPPPAAKGDPAAGKALFAENSCGSCHTYGPAGSNGKIGPDLGNLAADAQKASRGPVDAYVHESIANPNAYVVPGFPQGVMPSFAGLTPGQLDDLAAFLTRSS